MGQDVGGIDVFDEAEPDHRRCDPRRQRRARVERTGGQPVHPVARPAQHRDRAIAERDRDLVVGDAHRALGRDARHGKILQLGAVDRVGEVEHRLSGNGDPLRVRRGLAREPEEHRGGVGSAFRRVSAAVLQMAALAGAGIEQRAEPVGGLGRGRCGDPVLPEQRIAQLERAPFRETQIGGSLREGVPVGALARRGSAALGSLERLRPGEILGRAGNGPDAREILLGEIAARRLQGSGQRVCRGKADDRPETEQRAQEQSGRMPAGCMGRRRAARRFKGAPHPSS